MTLRFNKISIGLVVSLVLSVSVLQGCTAPAAKMSSSAAAAVEDKQFDAWFDNLISQIKANPKYDRMPINTKAQETEFLVWLHEAYRKTITKHELMRRINSTYPNHEYETSFIVSRLPH